MKSHIITIARIFLVFIFPCFAFSQGPSDSIPNCLSHSNLNMLINPGFAGTGGWKIASSAKFDSSESLISDGSGSIRFDDGIWASSLKSDTLYPVIAGKTYGFSGFMKTDTIPRMIIVYVHFYDSSQSLIGNTSGRNYTTSVTDDWQEFNRHIIIPPGVEYAELSIRAREYPITAGTIWVDNLYFEESIGYDSCASAKSPFNGGQVRIDGLGNYEIWVNGEWKPFFPLAVYGWDIDTIRPRLYSEQGFNTVLVSATKLGNNPVLRIKNAQNAVSAFNPNGMYTIFGFTSYTKLSDPVNYLNTTMIKGILDDLGDQELFDKVIAYYYDNETYPQGNGIYDATKLLADSIKAWEISKYGGRRNPIYFLQGNPGVSRAYNNIQDICGSYVKLDQPAWNLQHLHCLDEQESPVVFGQINDPRDSVQFFSNYMTPGEFRGKVYNGLIGGAKAFGYWRDHYPSVVYPWIEDLLWWPELPRIRWELDTLLPIIRQPHWTDWKAVSSAPSLNIGTRNYNGAGYMFYVNNDSVPVYATISLHGLNHLGYYPSFVKEFFTDSLVASISGGAFTLQIPAHGTGVLRLCGPKGSFVSAHICSTDSIFLGGAFQNTTGFYLDWYPAANGCDSVVVTFLVVHPAPDAGIGGAHTVSICDGWIDLYALLGGSPNLGGVFSDDSASGAQGGRLFIPSWAGVGTYGFTYRVSGSSYCSEATSHLLITVDSCYAGMKRMDPAKEISVFPNPANERIKIHLGDSSEEDWDLILLNMNGQVVMRRKIGRNSQMHEIGVQELPSGIYLLRLESPKGIFYKKCKIFH